MSVVKCACYCCFNAEPPEQALAQDPTVLARMGLRVSYN
jgi:hypothetical protein